MERYHKLEINNSSDKTISSDIDLQIKSKRFVLPKINRISKEKRKKHSYDEHKTSIKKNIRSLANMNLMLKFIYLNFTKFNLNKE